MNIFKQINRVFADACTCRLETVHSASTEPPETILNPRCPVHGKDPDAEYERKRDDAMWDRQCGWGRDEP